MSKLIHEIYWWRFVLTDKQRSGRPVEVSDKEIKEIIDMDRHSTTCDIAEKLNASHTCIQKRLQQIGYLKKIDLWVPYKLTEAHFTQHISVKKYPTFEMINNK